MKERWDLVTAFFSFDDEIFSCFLFFFFFDDSDLFPFWSDKKFFSFPFGFPIFSLSLFSPLLPYPPPQANQMVIFSPTFAHTSWK